MTDSFILDVTTTDEWEFHWIGMPEFQQVRKKPVSQITVRFETQEDMDNFAELIGQKLTLKTKSIWHPHRPHKLANKKVWRNGE